MVRSRWEQQEEQPVPSPGGRWRGGGAEEIVEKWAGGEVREGWYRASRHRDEVGREAGAERSPARDHGCAGQGDGSGEVTFPAYRMTPPAWQPGAKAREGWERSVVAGSGEGWMSGARRVLTVIRPL